MNPRTELHETVTMASLQRPVAEEDKQKRNAKAGDAADSGISRRSRRCLGEERKRRWRQRAVPGNESRCWVKKVEIFFPNRPSTAKGEMTIMPSLSFFYSLCDPKAGASRDRRGKKKVGWEKLRREVRGYGATCQRCSLCCCFLPLDLWGNQSLVGAE